jgi:hypothetical protein
MRKITMAVALGMATVFGALAPTQGAEIYPPPIAQRPAGVIIASSCRFVWICDRRGCDWRDICRRRPAAPYTGYPLYGAYGPYGGTAFWGAYTASGWGYH